MPEASVVRAAAALRLGSCVLGPYLDAFCAQLAELGYRAATIRSKLGFASDLARWLELERVAVADLDEGRIDAFLAARRRQGRIDRGWPRTARQLLEYLRGAGAARTPEAAVDTSPAAVLLARYERYLRRERGLAHVTVTAYLRVVRAFVRESVGDTDPARLDAQTVRDFLRGRAPGRRPVPCRAWRAPCVRSCASCSCRARPTPISRPPSRPSASGASRASPRPRRPRRGAVLDACDQSSAIGRRDHAILLLLARLGLRAGEVRALELDDVRWREGEIVVRGKGLVADRLPLPPEVGEALARYLRADRPAARPGACSSAPRRRTAASPTLRASPRS